MSWFFLFFFVSGFCSILYEIIWLRLAMAQFGVTSALVSLVLSTFMAGLALGSWASGHSLRKYERNLRVPALRIYAAAELLVAVSAVAVPYQLVCGRTLLERTALTSALAYYVVSGIWIALTLIPWCACMGATIPVAMAAIKEAFPAEAQRSFSYLYLANVIGAVFGAILPLLFVEMYGFHGTLMIAAALNGFLAVSATIVSMRHLFAKASLSSPLVSRIATPVQQAPRSRMLLAMLFATGLTSMGMEVVWIRQYTPYLGTAVYSFALILALYLVCTSIGSRTYRRNSRNQIQDARFLWVLLGPLALLPLPATSPNLHVTGLVRLMIGVGPFSAVLGFVTPMLVDRFARGEPESAGRAYAVNILGCILGPLLSGFVLLPAIGERWVLLALSIPFLTVGLLPWRTSWPEKSEEQRTWPRYLSYAFLLIIPLLLFATKGYEEQFERRVVLRDHTATVIATGEGRDKRLLVNGIGITYMTPITKMMAHLPLAFLNHQPQNALVICFGMGTSYRSLLSWGIPTTAVELVPSVPHLFWYYHTDAEQLLHSSLSKVVVDDGRRYLERTREQFDVITIDPPPPVQAAGSSLLYSKEFYSIVRQKLRGDGILQQWLPYADATTQGSVARALKESFPYVRVFGSVEGWGFHFLASGHPLPEHSAVDLVQRMPRTAITDLMEWGPKPTAEKQFDVVLQHEFSLDELIQQSPETPALRDDRPANEYYALRLWTPVLRQFLSRTNRPPGKTDPRLASLGR
jgi:spermidine synthase